MFEADNKYITISKTWKMFEKRHIESAIFRARDLIFDFISENDFVFQRLFGISHI